MKFLNDAIMKFLNKDLIPKSIVCWQEDYFRQYFVNDLAAGISIGIISLPLALAFAIASRVFSEKGLFTTIVAGFLISLLEESRVQIGGPTRAFVVHLLRLNNVPLIDETGINTIKKLCLKCRKKGINFLISDLQSKQYDLFRQSSLLKVIDENHIFDSVEAAIAYAKPEFSREKLS